MNRINPIWLRVYEEDLIPAGWTDLEMLDIGKTKP